MVYHPYGCMGTSPLLPPPGVLSVVDIQTPTPGWTPPLDPTADSPAQGTHVAAREWAESTLMTEHLVAHASRWMMTFHDSFLNIPAAVSSITSAHQGTLFLTYRTRTTHRPQFARRCPLYGAAFTSAARALQYAMEHVDIQYIYILSSAQCTVVDVTTMDRIGWHVDFHYERNRRQVRRCVISLKTILEHYGRFSDFCARIRAHFLGAHGQRQPKGEVERPSCSPISG